VNTSIGTTLCVVATPRAAKLGAAIRLLEEDLQAAFPDSAAVNNALRMLLALSHSVAPLQRVKKRIANKRAA
jgi:hypothetical protein